MLVFFDNCCLNRPWDDQSQLRVRLEAEAVVYLLEAVRLGNLEMVTSDYLTHEIIRHPIPERRSDLLSVLSLASYHVAPSQRLGQYALSLARYGIRGYDALHLATAELSRCDLFLTTDDRLAKRCAQANLRTQVLNPVDFPPSLLP